jgi:glucan-binding YG repeat protein
VTYGLYEIDGEYYFANWGGVVMTSGRYYVSTTFCDLPANANYSFGPDGKMLNGVEEVDGKLYLYKNGTTVSYGLYEVDGEYYFANWGGVLMTDGRYYVDANIGNLGPNNYSFSADGKMLNGFVEREDGIYYYVNGNTVTPRLIYVDGFYYYVSWGGKLVTNTTYYVPADGVYSEIPMNYTFNELGQFVG